MYSAYERYCKTGLKQARGNRSFISVTKEGFEHKYNKFHLDQKGDNQRWKTRLSRKENSNEQS